MANQRIKANLIPSCDIYPVIHLAQYDVSDGTGKQVEIELYYGTDKFTVPNVSSITFRGTKRDKTGYSYEITKFTDNVVTVDVKPQMTVLSGTHFAELRISKGNTISNTIKFVMKIDSSALADDTKVSETDLSVIEKALQASDAAIQAKAEVEKLKESVEASEKNAKQSETNASQSATNAQKSADSVANVVTDVNQLKKDLGNVLSPNLYNPADAKENTAIDQNSGTELSFDGWFATGYILVSKGEVLYFSSNGEPTQYSTGAFYDAKKKFISGFGNPNSNNNIEVTSDGYARFSFDSKKEKLQIEKAQEPRIFHMVRLKSKPK